MAKNREELEKEAIELGIDTSDFQTKTEVQEAIDAKKEENGVDENPTGDTTSKVLNNPEVGRTNVDGGEVHVYQKGVGEVRVGGRQPSDEVQYTEETVAQKAEQSVKDPNKNSKANSFETTKDVSFNVNGKQYEGKVFSFSTEVAEARKQMLIERYGADIIKEG